MLNPNILVPKKNFESLAFKFPFKGTLSNFNLKSLIIAVFSHTSEKIRLICHKLGLNKLYLW